MYIFGLGIGVFIIICLWIFLILISIIFYKRGLKTILPILMFGSFITTILVVWPKDSCVKDNVNKKEDGNNEKEVYPQYYPIFFSVPLLIISTIVIIYAGIKEIQLSLFKPFHTRSLFNKRMIQNNKNTLEEYKDYDFDNAK
uniref:Transmembrane protein n=1 Tax=Parastrongyloides trichosuri TaxID=131310 RepID=A0A0N4Z079_PARTI